MKKIQFTIEINAAKEKVWEALWKDENYREWTAAFHEGSYYKSDLQEGGKIHFLNPDNNGMFGIVEKNVPFEKMHFLHKGEVKNGEEQEETYGSEAIEQYDLEEKDGTTSLSVTMNSPEEYLSYFTDVFPKALEKVKEIAEKN